MWNTSIQTTGKRLVVVTPNRAKSSWRTAPLALGRVQLPFAPLTGLLVMTVFAQIRKDPGLLTLLLETAQGALETLILVDDYLSHKPLTLGVAVSSKRCTDYEN